MNRTILPFVLIFLGFQFHEVSAGDLGVQRWSNRFDPSTGTLALEPQKKPAPEQTPAVNSSEFVAVKECYWDTSPSGKPVFVHNPSFQHESVGSTHTSSPTDSRYSSGDEGGSSRPDDQTLKTQKSLERSAKNHQRELYWGTDSDGKPLLIREENPPDEPTILIKHNIISCEGDDCEEDIQNDPGPGNKDFVFDDSEESSWVASEDSPEEPGDLEKTTRNAESDDFSENYSQERGHWSPDGDSEIRAEEHNPETSESLNGESDEETYQSEPEDDRQEGDYSAADANRQRDDPINYGNTVEAGGDTGDLFDDFSSWTQKASEDRGLPKATFEGSDTGDLFDDFSSWTQ